MGNQVIDKLETGGKQKIVDENRREKLSFMIPERIPTTVYDYVNSEFRLTSKHYSFGKDLDYTEAVSGEFPGFEICDWTDLEKYVEQGGNILSLFDKVGLKEYDCTAGITHWGDRTWRNWRCDGSRRYWHVSRHNGHLPTNYTYLAQKSINELEITLGSCPGKKKILCIKKKIARKIHVSFQLILTKSSYSMDSDWTKALKEEFPEEKDLRVCDFKDLMRLESVYEKGTVPDFADIFGSSAFRVFYRGQQVWELSYGTGYYIAIGNFVKETSRSIKTIFGGSVSLMGCDRHLLSRIIGIKEIEELEDIDLRERIDFLRENHSKFKIKFINMNDKTICLTKLLMVQFD